MQKVEKILTHEKPHLDEIVAIWLLKKFGENEFPGVKTAEISYCSNGGEVTKLEEGILPIGVGGSIFDEHPRLNGEKKEDECAATLVAKYLSVDEEPAMEKLLKFVLNSDLKGANNPFDLAYLVKLLHQQYPEQPEKVIEWAITGLEAKYYEQLQFWTGTKKEFEDNAQIEEVQGPHGRMLKIVTIASDDEQMSKYARSSHGCSAAIVIQKWSSGNVQIFTNKQHRLTLYDVAQMIRYEEQKKKGNVVTTEWKILSSEGKVEGAEEWYYHHSSQTLFNGSLTAKNVPPTKLALEQIRRIVRIGVSPGLFEPNRNRECKLMICTSTRRSQCPWYVWGLHRCRQIRFEMSQKR